MAFNSLTDKLQNIFKGLKGKGLISEEMVKETLKEIKMALLEADVNFKVVKTLIKNIETKTIGTNVLKGLNPAQSIIKIVRDELIELMGSETTEIRLDNFSIIMMVGLQGAGKTTTASKLASKFKNKGRKPLLVGCDIYRPAAIEQLKINANKVGVDVFEIGTDFKPLDISLKAIEYAKNNKFDTVIIDTAGRLHIDENMMEELKEIKNSININYTILVVDSMTGQDAVKVASDFDNVLDINGVILTKMDGDTRGGAALSIKAVTNKPILYVGMGEKLSDLEQFYPDRMAGRILGMGDMLSLIDKLQEEASLNELPKNIETKKDFDLEDFLESFKQMKKIGGMQSLLGFLPNMKGLNLNNIEIDENQIKRTEAIILSMTKKERQNPSLLNASRRKRIANGAGTTVQEVNILIKNFEKSKDMMKIMMKTKNKKNPFSFF